MRALQLAARGDPSEVVRLVDVPDVGPPRPGEVVIDVEASPVEPTDLAIIAGTYGYLPPLPHLLGAQGVGRVAAVGRDVDYVREGDRTLVPLLSNAWAERVRTDVPWLRPLPKGDVGQLSMLGIDPPTACLLLTEFVRPRAGEWVIQNAANSGVGRSVIALARSRGLRTVNVVRRPELLGELTALGGDVVLVDGPELAADIAAATDGAPIALALDGVGGASTQRLLDAIAPCGTVVVYAGMSGEPARVSNPSLVYAGQTLRGFWVVNWLREQTSVEKVASLYRECAAATTPYPIAGEFGLGEHAEALTVAAKFRGKAIFRPNG
ncbi:zinc-dependent alcohol dehydrogenase family protein [Dactylosporangium sp. CS-033363]|uniref:zinc-dependent alcohol dehydrogenase family protein n=1 Tax=Dactylosporangium sp. CS-033363 TaxID=3239935 RepID=UPI003D921B44